MDMGPPTLSAPDVPTTLQPTNAEGGVVGAGLEVDGKTWKVTCVSMGNPHCITFSNDAEQVSYLLHHLQWEHGCGNECLGELRVERSRIHLFILIGKIFFVDINVLPLQRSRYGF